MASFPDYREIYKNVNQVTRAVASRQGSEVMSIHRMYFKLDELEVEQLTEADTVKELVVFADVVGIEGQRVKLPASRTVTVVCRILHVKQEAVELRFDSFGPVDCDRGWLPYIGEAALILSNSPQVRLSIYAQQVVCNYTTRAVVQVAHPVTVSQTVSPHNPSRYAIPGTMKWRVEIAPDQPDLSAAERSYELRTERFWEVMEKVWGIDEQEWSLFTHLLQGPVSLPPAILGDSNIILGMQSTLLIAELVLSYQTHAQDTVSAAKAHLQWLITNLLQVLDDNSLDKETREQLLALQARAELASKLPLDGSHTLIVPRLEYGQYQGLINSMATVAEAYNSEFTAVNLFIQQNEILGSYLLQQNKAFAARERDMETFHGLALARKQQELRTAQESMEDLSAQLTQQTEAMDQAKRDMDAGLKKYRDEQVAKAFFAVLKGVLAIGAAIFTGGAAAGPAVNAGVDAVKGVSSLAGKLDMVLDIMERMEKVMEVLNAVNDLVTALSEINKMVEAPEMPSVPSTYEWDIFENEMEEVAESMPTEVTEARTWKTKCKNVAAVCRAICNTASYIGQLQYDVFVQSNQALIAGKQAERLEAMQPADLTNFLEMATQMDMRTSRMLLNLLKVMTIQNAALLFHFLLPPVPFTGWVTVDMVRNALVKHEADALAARERLGPSTDFVQTYVMSDIPVSLLLDGDDWIFTIDPADGSTFPLSWSRVRILYLEMKFTGGEEFHKPTTSSGRVYILLQASRNFQDRLHGDVLHFEAAVPLRYQYAYDLRSGETTVSNRPSQQHDGEYMQMTPFGQWRLRLSASAVENQGLAFPTAVATDLDSSTTQISITFHLTAVRRIDTRAPEEL